MTCREVYGFLDEFLDGVLDVDTKRAFEGHLSRCGACERYLETYRAAIAAARNAENAGATAEAPPEELIQAILASKPKAEAL